MNRAVKPAAGMRLYYLDGAGVLFSQSLQELHLLNPTATLIWSLLEECNHEPGIVAALHQTYGLDREGSRRFAAQALAEWRVKGFLAESDGVAHDAPAPQPHQAPTGPAWPGPARHEERRYWILNSDVTVRYSSAAQTEVVHPALEHLTANRDVRPGSVRTIVDVIDASNRLLVYRDRELFATCLGTEALAPVVKSLVWMTALRDQRYFLNVHAGVVSDGASCILLPAAPGSGKSTLTAALIHTGYEYFSDEVALLEDVTLNVFPVPLAICVKESGIDALADRFPQLRSIAIHDRADGKRVAYVPPPADRLPAMGDARPVTGLIFPRFTQAEKPAFVPLPRAEALQRLLGECLGVSEALDMYRVDALVQWISRISCHALTYGCTDEAVAEVASVFPRPRAAR